MGILRETDKVKVLGKTEKIRFSGSDSLYGYGYGVSYSE
jgi:hypothetical protein